MKVAIPDWQGRVSPVFDVAEQVALVDLDNGEVDDRHMVSLGTTTPHQRARQLVELGVDVVVCGAISWPLEVLLIANRIRVISLICGGVTEVVRAFRDGTLQDEQFAMPSGYLKERRTRNRRWRRGNGARTEESP